MRRRDAAALLSIVAPQIEFSFGGSRGKADFARDWALSGRGPSPIWPELEAVLRLGCARGDDGTFWAPSLFVQSAGPDDPFTTYVAVAQGAGAYREPVARGQPVARLDWDVLEAEGDDGSSLWLRVRLRDGRRAFVRRADVRSVIDYRAGFQRMRGRWMMTVFIAGD